MGRPLLLVVGLLNRLDITGRGLRQLKIRPSTSSLAEMIEDREAQLTARAAHIALLREALGIAIRALIEDDIQIGWSVDRLSEALTIHNDDTDLREWGAKLLEEMADRGFCVYDEEQLLLRAAELRSGK